MRLRLPSILALAVVVAASVGRAGTVWTSDGKMYEGDTALRAGGIVVSAREQQEITVEWGRISRATFNAPKPATIGAGYLGSLSAHGVGIKVSAEDVTFSRGLYVFRTREVSRDGFVLLSQGLFGDADVSARLCASDNSGAAGITFRESLEAEAREVTLRVEGGHLVMECRNSAGAEDARTDLGAARLPLFLRLNRVEGQARAFTSADGAAWKQVAGPSEDNATLPAIPVSLPAGMLGGMVFSGGDGACFDSLVVRDGETKVAAPASAHAAQFHALPHEAFLKGVLLRQGSFLAGATLDGNAAPPTVSWHGQSFPGIASHLARAQKDDIPAALFARVPISDNSGRTLKGGTGALLLSGDYLGGDILSYEKNSLEINNILLGITTLRADQALAIAFHPTEVPPPGFRVELADGTVLLAPSIDVSGSECTMNDATIGRFTFRLRDLLSIQRTSGTTSLNDLSFTVSGPPNADAEALTCFGRASGIWLAAGTRLMNRGIVMPAGTVLTCRPGPAHKLQATLAVPRFLPPAVHLQFTLAADGKEIYRSPELSSQDEPVPVSLPLASPATLSLRVEEPRLTTLPAFGVWGEGTLLP
jgi:hypothetical protein